MNYNLICVDDTHIYVGDYTMFGPNVTITTAGHPILPGVTIGDNVVADGHALQSIHLMTPQPIFAPEFPEGCVVKSSGFSCMMTALPMIS